MDELVTGKWVFDYRWRLRHDLPRRLVLLRGAFVVTSSSFLCIEAVLDVVPGDRPVKACLVFFFGWVIFAAPITANVMGCSLAVRWG